ncbi:MAG TPA: helix-turn-helix domain-containing protein [Bacilli bacterium]|nr:helix-turn-helix domain-containing protein [Bacilli bacterium]
MNTTTPLTLGSRIRELRLSRGLSQRALADGLVSKSMISQIEGDKALPSTDLLTSLAARLDVTVQELLPAKQNDVERVDRYKQARSLLALGHDEEALPLLQACLEDPHPAWELTGLYKEVGECLQRLGRVAEARSSLEEALRRVVREGREADKASLHMRLGEIAYGEEQWTVALQEWKQAHQDLTQMTEREGRPPMLFVHVCLALGRVQAALGWHLEALRHYREAQHLLPQVHPRVSPSTEADVYNGLGESLAHLGQHATAMEHLQRAVTFYERTRMIERELQARILLGRMMAANGQPERALRELAACRRVAEARGELDLVVKVMREQAVVCQQMERWDEAIATLRQALSLDGCDAESKGGLHRLLAETYAAKERWDQALNEAEQARACLNEERSGEELYKVYCLLTTIYKQRADYKVANDWVIHSNRLLQRQLLKKGWIM